MVLWMVTFKGRPHKDVESKLAFFERKSEALAWVRRHSIVKDDLAVAKVVMGKPAP